MPGRQWYERGPGEPFKAPEPGSSPPPTVHFKHPGGMADYYADSYKILKDFLGGQKGMGGQADLFADILGGFKGGPGELEGFMERAAPFLAQSLRGGAGAQYMLDPSNWDMGAMGAYGPGAGQIGLGGAQAQRAGQGALARMGLGRSGASAALAQQALQQTTGQQAGLFSNLFQRAQQNRMMNAQNAYGINRDIAQLALGQTPTPRMSGGGPSQGAAGLSGALAGVGALAPLGGVGAAVGGILGGIGGLLS